MNTDEPKQSEPVVEAKKEEPTTVTSPKQGWFFPNVAEGLPFGIEAETRAEAEAANKHYLESQKHKETK